MKQYEAVIEAMRRNGGFHTLGGLYRTVPKIESVVWGTKTPFASIRRIVQDPRFFFKIRPGLWALNECRGRLPSAVEPKTSVNEEKYTHVYFQGLLVEMGNIKRFGTVVPGQDKGKTFLNARLGDAATLSCVPEFSYERFVRRVRTVDVAWFNDREMPASLFEVEHTTDMKGALEKFAELQDFNCKFTIVAADAREREFHAKLSATAYRDVKARVTFCDYDTLSRNHTHLHELVASSAGKLLL